jgi:hypothetical protein
MVALKQQQQLQLNLDHVLQGNGFCEGWLALKEQQ